MMTPFDQQPLSPHPETTADNGAGVASLHAAFLADERPAYLGLYTGARCVLPTGGVIEVHGRRTPFFAICRKLEALGWGENRIEISTLQGTQSMRGKVSTLAGLRIEESDKNGLRLRAYRPFPPARVAKERNLGPEGTQTPENGKTRVSESTTRVEAA